MPETTSCVLSNTAEHLSIFDTTDFMGEIYGGRGGVETKPPNVAFTFSPANMRKTVLY